MLRRLPPGRLSCRGVQQDGFDRRRTNAPQFCLNPVSGTQRITIDPHVLTAAVLSVHRRGVGALRLSPRPPTLRAPASASPRPPRFSSAAHDRPPPSYDVPPPPPA